MNLFLDFDGTLIDSRARLFHLFNHLVPASAFDFDAYWAIKRRGVGHKEILQQQFGYSVEAVEKFQQEWLRQIERPEWLKYDKPIDRVFEKLIQLKVAHELILVTARQSVEMVEVQLNALGWKDLFQQVLVTEQKIEKVDLIRKHVTVSEQDWLIGDTGKDIKTGKQLNIHTAAVLSGFLNEEKLRQYHPDLLLNSIVDFVG